MVKKILLPVLILCCLLAGIASLGNDAKAAVTQVNDNSGGITYSGTWTYLTGQAGYIDGDTHYNNVNATYVQFTFTGASIKWIGDKAFNHGKADVYIDGVLDQAGIDTYAAVSISQQVLYQKTGLTNASHTIKVVVMNTKNASSSGYYQNVDAFEYAVPDQVNDDASGVNYFGAWTDDNSQAGYINNDTHYSDVNGAYVEYTFTGSSIKWIGSKSTNHGKANVYIDGVLDTSGIDTYSATWTRQLVLYQKTGLTDASHTIKIVVTNTKNVSSAGYYLDVDAFESFSLIAPAPTATPGPAAHSWTIATDDTSIKVGVTSNNKLAMYELKNPADGWNWTTNATWLPMMTKVIVGGTTYDPINWVYSSATVDTSNGTKVTIKFTSTSPNLELRSEWWAKPGKGPVRQSAYVVNNSGSTATVYRNDMFNMKVTGSANSVDKLKLWRFNDDGIDADATGVYQDMINDALFNVSDSVTPAQDKIPFVVLDLNQTRGIYFGAEWSILNMNVTGVSAPSSIIGANVVFKDRNNNFRTDVSNGATFAYPPGFVGAYKGTIDDGGNSLRPYLFNNSMPALLKNDTTYPKVEWGTFAAVGKVPDGWDPVESKYYPLIDDIAPLGFESTTLDVGWWSSYNDPGNILTDTVDWPSGILAAATYAHNRSMKFGIYSNEPEDMANPAQVTERINDLKYLKNTLGGDFWRSDNTGGADMISGTYGAGNNAHYPEDVDYWSVKGFYDVLDNMLSTVTDWEWENCNAGGQIKDFGAMKRAARISNVDHYSTLTVRKAFYDSSFAIHPMQILGVVGTYYGIGDVSDASVYDFRSSAQGAFNWFPDAPNGGNGGPVWTAQMKTDITKAVTTYKTKLRPLIRKANLYHIFPRPTGTIWDGVEYYDPATLKGAVYIFRPLNSTTSSQSIVLKGLIPAKNYQLAFEDGTNSTVTMSGSALMSTGISVTLSTAKLSEIMWITEL